MKIEPNRICFICKTKKTYLNNGYAQWHRHPEEKTKWLCAHCFNKFFYGIFWRRKNHGRLMLFKKKVILLPNDPRKGICELCGKHTRTHMHHLQYDETEPLAYTVELCGACHWKEHYYSGYGGKRKMTNKIVAYWSHPFESEVKGAASIILRHLQTALPDWQFENPFESPLTEVWLKDPTNITTAKSIVNKDLKLICQSDVVVAYLPDVPMAPRGIIGTPCEMFYAAYFNGTPVYCLTPFVHPWLLAFDVFCTDNIEVLIKKLKELNEK